MTRLSERTQMVIGCLIIAAGLLTLNELGLIPLYPWESDETTEVLESNLNQPVLP